MVAAQVRQRMPVQIHAVPLGVAADVSFLTMPHPAGRLGGFLGAATHRPHSHPLELAGWPVVFSTA